MLGKLEDSMFSGLQESSKIFEFDKKASLYIDGKEIIIIKSNALIEGAYDLTPAEHDLITLAINKSHNQKTMRNQVRITAKEFAIANKIHEKYAYQVLKETAKTLHKRTLKCNLYIDETKEKEGYYDFYSVAKPKGSYRILHIDFNWLQAIMYEEQSGFVHLVFSDYMTLLINKTGEAYTRYDYTKTIDLKGFHTKRLYELACKWAAAKPMKGKKYPSIRMDVDDWKDFFGCADKYEKVAEFKRWVIIPSINQINSQNEFELTLSDEKLGRNITHFSIEIKDKRKKSSIQTLSTDTSNEKPQDTFKKYTDAQLARAVHSVKFMNDYSSLVSPNSSANQSSSFWISHMVECLKKEPNKFNKRPMQEYLDDVQANRF